MSQSISRRLYRRLLRMHPEPFRQEFEEEMLGVFEECSADQGPLFLIADAFFSAVRQHVRYHAAPVPNRVFFYSEVPASPTLAARLATAMLVLILAASAGVERARPKQREFQITYAAQRVVLYSPCSGGCSVK